MELPPLGPSALPHILNIHTILWTKEASHYNYYWARKLVFPWEFDV